MSARIQTFRAGTVMGHRFFVTWQALLQIAVRGVLQRQ